MLDVRHLNAQDLRGLSREVMAQVAQPMLASLAKQSRLIGEQSKQLDERDKRISSQAQAIKFKDAKLEKIALRAGAPDGLALRRQDRGDERRAAPDVR